jgi:UDP-glucuronate 4-epimerase
VRIIVTGAAGFIGAATCHQLLARGHEVHGLDCINAYYSVTLKRWRLEALGDQTGFTFHHVDLSETTKATDLIVSIQPDLIIHLAAQAGVRASAEIPFDYVASNLVGHMTVLEAARRLPDLRQLVYASSSSVYGDRSEGKFTETDRVDNPTSLYAATKRADELMSQVYATSYSIAITGLRFFTVYGPAGRPDMAYYTFAEKMVAGEPIEVFDEGLLKRDFTYIDDIVAGILAVSDAPPQAGQHRVYNIGNDEPQTVIALVRALEKALGVKADINFAPKPAYDVTMTAANIDAMRKDFNWAPTTDLETGIGHFGKWFLDWKARYNA